MAEALIGVVEIANVVALLQAVTGRLEVEKSLAVAAAEGEEMIAKAAGRG